jgi:hypothetical protein
MEDKMSWTMPPVSVFRIWVLYRRFLSHEVIFMYVFILFSVFRCDICFILLIFCSLLGITIPFWFVSQFYPDNL